SRPKPGEISTKHLDSEVKNIQTGNSSMIDFPPIPGFSIYSQEVGQVTFSLGNRKLYIAKKAAATEIPTIQATWEQIYNDSWKLTSQTDGPDNFPSLTNDSKGKEASPPDYTLLGQFRRFL